MKEVYNFINSNIKINNNDKIIVAVSYGPDSMALLEILNKKFNGNIICAHVHHNHRLESDTEAVKLKEYCDQNNIIFEMMKIKKYKKDKFTEEEARNKRYIFFDKLIEKYNSNYLFTAHHGDDLIETVMMKLVRGSSLNGYSGIKLISKRNNYYIIRPLLFVTKKDLVDYCANNKINYAIDNSNSDNSYTRNRYRNKILPFLKEENKNVHKNFLSFSNELQEYERYMDNITKKNFNEVCDGKYINLKLLCDNDNLVIKRVIKLYLFNYYNKDIYKLNDKHINSILNLINNKKTNGKISLPNNINIIKSYNKLYFDINNDYNDYCFILSDYLKLPNNYVIKKITSLENNSNYITTLNSSEITLPLYIRNKIDGDKIEVLGLNGSKKIKDIFVAEKIPREFRIKYPVLIDSKGKILWLPGLKKSKYDKSKTGKYDIILKYCKEEYNDTTK